MIVFINGSVSKHLKLGCLLCVGVGVPFVNLDTTLCPQIQEAESEARSKHLGIWEDQEEIDISDNAGYICSSNYYNCGDFTTHAEAQEVFEACGSGDVHQLDRDKDGLACETLP